MKKTLSKAAVYLFTFVLTGFIVLCVHLFYDGPSAAILMYHSVGASNGRMTCLDVTEEAFARQMAFLHARGFHVIRLEELAGILRRGEKVGPRTVVITFDDGYDNNYTKAFPILKKYGLPATIFVIAGRLGENYDVARGISARIMTREMMQEMVASGLVDIGSHTTHHYYLPDVQSESLLWEEIRGSKTFLESVVGAPVVSLAYPLGGHTRSTEEMARRAGYEVAVGTNRKDPRAGTDLFALKRIRISQSSSNMLIFFLEASGYYPRLKRLAS
ncbi:MAG: polysaccharide deacetylase family protein [Candidatus Omnitrophica bacterium]|nr:polysaccharide deacetylase family protein [Candidatus Omnitrophota bacterium]MDD5137788.1 polysaccharide deacetylase family protein [Candidatus Omnitrophota bacterium]MDD5538218.1 polysaccharide deacetylase family protein [Candidatus Omnitrophota bacterium]